MPRASSAASAARPRPARTARCRSPSTAPAGRADLAGEVLLQSHLPDHYALTLACAQDYPQFYEREMEFRRTMAYPPAGAVLNLLIRDRDAVRGAEAARSLASRLREMAAGR